MRPYYLRLPLTKPCENPNGFSTVFHRLSMMASPVIKITEYWYAALHLNKDNFGFQVKFIIACLERNVCQGHSGSLTTLSIH